MRNTIRQTAAAGVLMVALSGCNLGGLMVNEQQSPYDFDTTVATIESNIQAQGWLMPKVYDFQQSLLKHNQPDPGRVKIFKLCKPEYAGPLLLNDDSKFVAAMMPCSVSVYEKSDGKTYVSSMNMGLMAKMFGGDVGRTLAQVAHDDSLILGFLDH